MGLLFTLAKWLLLTTREGNYKLKWLLNQGVEDIDKDCNSLIKSKVFKLGKLGMCNLNLLFTRNVKDFFITISLKPKIAQYLIQLGDLSKRCSGNISGVIYFFCYAFIVLYN